MFGEEILTARFPVTDQLDLVRELLAGLHTRMSEAAHRNGGLQDLARIAADAAGMPVVIALPDLGTALAPRFQESQESRESWERWALSAAQSEIGIPPAQIALQVPVRHAGRTAGFVVALVADGDDGFSLEAIDPAGSLDPLVPWILDVAAATLTAAVAAQDARIETEHRLRGSFLEQLRSGERLEGAQIIRRANRLGCNLAHGAVMLCVEAEGGRPGLIALTIADEYPGAFVEPIEPLTEGPMQVWAILPSDGGGADVTQEAAKRLAASLRQYGPVGLSRFHSDPAEFSLGLDEAELMLDVMRKAALPPGEEGVEGTYKLLFRLLASHPDELHTYHSATIGPLVQHDEQYRTDLVRTLEVYLDTNCNMNLTADAIFAHRHTVAHRLDRIRELTELDPTQHEDREQLGLGLKIHRLTT